MPSFTSSSDTAPIAAIPPSGRWLVPWLAALGLAILFAAGLEIVLAVRGFRPTVIDSPALWIQQRHRASEQGSSALILVGASRAQLDIDLPTLGRLTALEPVQLAIDGSSFIPVLADLASDDSITGTILVEYEGAALSGAVRTDGSLAYLDALKQSQVHRWQLDYRHSEQWLANERQRLLRSYADGSSPFAAMLARALAPRVTPQYLVTLPSRQREADYRLVEMPAFYLTRAIRNAGIEAPDLASNETDFIGQIDERIRALPLGDFATFADNTHKVAAMVERIRARGGKVVFIGFPTTGLVRVADEVRYPDNIFWKKFIEEGLDGFLSSDVPMLRGYACPDGSHLDRRDQVGFTEGLVSFLKSRGLISSQLKQSVVTGAKS